MSGSPEHSSGPAKMTSREISIIRIVLQSAPEPITVKKIAGKLNVSTRTILRELPRIEEWFNRNQFLFIRKPSVGVAIPESSENIRIIRDLLDTQKVQKIYSRQERQRHIIGELLFAKEPIKSYSFLSKLHISEGSLSGDLDSLNEWFRDYGIQIIRRPGAGILLEGEEASYRKAIVSAAFEFLNEGEILNMIRGSEEEHNPKSRSVLYDRLSGVIEPDMIAFVEYILSDTEEQLNIRYADSGYMALVVHLSLAIRRIQAGERISMEDKEYERLTELPEYFVAGRIAQQVSERFDIELPAAEIGYITMHLSGARIWPKTKTNRGKVTSSDPKQVTLGIVQEVEDKTGLPFHTCTRMIEELTVHVASMLSRLTLDVRSNNLRAALVRDSYPDIYKAVESACGVFLEILPIEKIAQTEIDLVAMHFAASAESLLAEQRRLLVAVVCPSGMGGSRVLAANLMRSFPNIEIRQILSAIRLQPQELENNGIELVISTVPIQIDFPVICVNPILQPEDHQLISRRVEEIAESRLKRVSSLYGDRKKRKAEITMEDMVSITNTGLEIQRLLDHFTILSLVELNSMDELIDQASSLFAEDMISRIQIGKDLKDRERIKSTFLPQMNIHLLHCRTAAIDSCRFGFLKLSTPLQLGESILEGAVIMLAPASTEEGVEVISRMSTLLAEDEQFLEALKCADEKKGKHLAEHMLLEYYETKIQQK